MKMLILHSPSVDEGKGLVDRVCNTGHTEEAATSPTDSSLSCHTMRRLGANKNMLVQAAREAAGTMGTADHAAAAAGCTPLHRLHSQSFTGSPYYYHHATSPNISSAPRRGMGMRMLRECTHNLPRSKPHLDAVVGLAGPIPGDQTGVHCDHRRGHRCTPGRVGLVSPAASKHLMCIS